MSALIRGAGLAGASKTDGVRFRGAGLAINEAGDAEFTAEDSRRCISFDTTVSILRAGCTAGETFGVSRSGAGGMTTTCGALRCDPMVGEDEDASLERIGSTLELSTRLIVCGDAGTEVRDLGEVRNSIGFGAGSG